MSVKGKGFGDYHDFLAFELVGELLVLGSFLDHLVEGAVLLV